MKQVKLKNFYTPRQTFFLTFFIFPLFSQIIVGGFATVFLSAILALATGSSFADTEKGETATYLTFFTLVFVYLFTFFAIKGLLKIRQFSLSDIGLKAPTAKDIWTGVFGYVAFFFFFLVLNGILLLLPFIDTEQVQQISELESESVGAMITLFIGLVVAAPLVEEVVFRGFLYTGLRSKMRFWPALLITSLFFGLVHGEFFPSFNFTAVIVTFFLSFFLVYVKERTNSLTAPIVIHAMNNFLAYLFVFALN